MNSFLQGRKTSSEAALTPPQAATASPIAAILRPGVVPGTNVEVVKEGDKVVRLVVTCSCGERIEIECLYPAG